MTPDGSIISNHKYSNIRRSTVIITQKLINFINSNPHTAALVSKPTKMSIKTMFVAKYQNALLELKAEQKLLRLCSDHWKADFMLVQVLL
jgi:hypothetical protein